MIRDFLNALVAGAPEGSALMFTQFRGDPNKDGRWAVRPLKSVRQLDPDSNVYITTATMFPSEDGRYRRKRENFAAGCALMIDDVGTGAGAKAPWSVIEQVPPTALIETSPDNHQAVYMFTKPITDREYYSALIAAFIRDRLSGEDTGMAGVNRVFRPPIGVNGKAKYGGWRVRGREWAPERRYDPQRLAEALDLKVVRARARPRGATRDRSESIQYFVRVRAAARASGILKDEDPDPAGWQRVRCPWVDEHTDARDDGAAIREPAEENEWTGAFRCHHAGCAHRGWRDFSDVFAQTDEMTLAAANQSAGNWEQYDG